jgi:hypothetical protein
VDLHGIGYEFGVQRHERDINQKYQSFISVFFEIERVHQRQGIAIWDATLSNYPSESGRDFTRSESSRRQCAGSGTNLRVA